MTSEDYTYVAYRPCGCLAALCTEDCVSLPKSLAKWARQKLRIERVKTEAVRVMDWRCAEHPAPSSRSNLQLPM